MLLPEDLAIPNLNVDRALITWFPSVLKFRNSTLSRPALSIEMMRDRYAGEDFVVCRPGIGGPASVTALEILIASGITKFMVFGSCGSLDPTLHQRGDIVYVSRAYTDGGIPRAYEYVSPWPQHHVGLTDPNGTTSWTTDAIFMETPSRCEAMRMHGCTVVEMELAYLFAVAQFRRVAIDNMLVVSDLAYTPGRGGAHWTGSYDELPLDKLYYHALATLVKM